MMAAYDQIHNAGAVGEYMMDGGGAILNPEGVPIAGPVYASCNYCLKDNHTYSYDWARAGCALPVKGPENIGLPGCTVIDIPGLPAGEIILAAPASRATVYRKKLYQDAVGNYARPDIWSVTWHNAPKDTMFTDIPMTTDGLKGYDAGAAQFDAPGDAAPNGPIRLEDPEL
ncbi:hypothetical protein HXX76_011564 [Chlamydomonas incerta]|uniref:Uncharacterized protein n=1 Tax=Chlamydomonas incerta TaxID=51695 RepID=A0A835VWT7_CHLIN|nr:hypothetical protein HXX76_011564 [Chlamydomonas incerta]|eukprot:KAG2428444.1 hypothetical protein HXX76_011564 [Chlamydomonas incerta]